MIGEQSVNGVVAHTTNGDRFIQIDFGVGFGGLPLLQQLMMDFTRIHVVTGQSQATALTNQAILLSNHFVVFHVLR